MTDLDLPRGYVLLHEALDLVGRALCKDWTGAEIGPTLCRSWDTVPEHGADHWMLALSALPVDDHDPAGITRLNDVLQWVRSKGLPGGLKLHYFSDHGRIHSLREEDFVKPEGPAAITTGYLFDKPIFVRKAELLELITGEPHYLGRTVNAPEGSAPPRPVSAAELKREYVLFREAYQKEYGRLPGRTPSIDWGRQTFGERVTDRRLRAVYEWDAERVPRKAGRPRKPGQKLS